MNIKKVLGNLLTICACVFLLSFAFTMFNLLAKGVNIKVATDGKVTWEYGDSSKLGIHISVEREPETWFLPKNELYPKPGNLIYEKFKTDTEHEPCGPLWIRK